MFLFFFSITELHVGSDQLQDTACTTDPDQNDDMQIHDEQIAETFGAIEESTLDEHQTYQNNEPAGISTNVVFEADVESISNQEEEYSTTEQNEVLQWYVLFIGTWMHIFNISQRAVEPLLQFMAIVFKCLKQGSELLSKECPSSIYKLKSMLGVKKDTFERHIVCPKYDEATCLRKEYCDYIRYPNHSFVSKRVRCGMTLGRVIKYQHAERKFLPCKTYCYNSISKTLKLFFSRPNFYQNCQQWHSRQRQPGYYRDIYDGRIWREFDSFLSSSSSCNLALMLNIDWFQPYKNSPHSVGAIYLSIMNLPRRLRFKLENIMLVGMIPGPHEPNADGLVHYIKPLVDELLQLYNTGVTVITNGNEEHIVKAALLCIAADLPAARKLCGFLGHAAKVGCSKCKKEFETGTYYLLYSYLNFS